MYIYIERDRAVHTHTHKYIWHYICQDPEELKTPSLAPTQRPDFLEGAVALETETFD
jgi:hypothetical protein